ncbi:MAG: neutral/alkaline non-lysosomal ceramidase N-terminal domain-containing protein [Bacteroidia bacterium]
MKKVMPRLSSFSRLLFLPFLMLAGYSGIFAQNTLRAGVAKVNITPSVPILMSGYGNRTEPFKGVHDSIYATAMVFDDGSHKAAMVTADLIGFSHEFSAEVRRRIYQATGIDSQYVMLVATHNHGGPANRTYGDGAAPETEAYIATLKDKLVAVAKAASSRLQPVLLGAAEGSCTMNINRRARLADGSIWLGRNPDGPCDHTVSVVRIDDLNHNPLAVFVNWPCHGTVSGQDNYQITGDWPGAVARFVEKAFEGKVIVPVTAGASGDINPIYGPGNEFRDIDAIGMLVGEEVVRIARLIETFPEGKIESLQRVAVAQGKKPLPTRAPNQNPEPGPPVDIRFSAMKIGKIVFAGISGELMTEMGMAIKDESPYRHTIVITHCNGSSGYLCTDAAYPKGGYEVMVTRCMPGTEALITTTMREMVHALE